MNAVLICERPGLPPVHPRRQRCKEVHTPIFIRLVSADLLKAFPSKQLAQATDVLDVSIAIIVFHSVVFKIICSRHSQPGILNELAKKILKKFGRKRHVSVQVRDEVERELARARVARVECKNLSAKMTLFALGHPQ